MKLLLGKCEEVLKELPDNSVDSVVTDPPYGLSFMGKGWDYDVPSVEQWKEVYRVLKPGGHLLSFASTRTQHRMTVNIEDAGFDIRDMIAWIYGSGFPKSLNIGKSVDEKLGNKREVIGTDVNYGVTTKEEGKNAFGDYAGEWDITKGDSEWEGWGTALKPALEPITVARKPLSEGTVVENVLKHGTGGINIDESRIPTEEDQRRPSKGGENGLVGSGTFKIRERTVDEQIKQPGRFPANLIHDGSSEVTELFPDNAGAFAPVKSTSSGISNGIYGDFDHKGDDGASFRNDEGSAARFFYCAKASKSDRNEGCEDLPKKAGGSNAKGYTKDVERGLDRNRPVSNHHPTVKPTPLMEYLVKLVTPKGGTVLDPFMGSGSTGKACKRLDFDFIGIEMNEDYMNIAKARIERAMKDGEVYIPPKQREITNKFFDI